LTTQKLYEPKQPKKAQSQQPSLSPLLIVNNLFLQAALIASAQIF